MVAKYEPITKPSKVVTATCTCSEIQLDGNYQGQHTGSFNWNPRCQQHGLGTAWYDSPEQVAKREARSTRLRDLQRQAREAKAKARQRVVE